MTATDAYEFTVIYDEASLRAAAHTLVSMRWRRLRPWTWGSLILVLAVGGVLDRYVGQPTLIWFAILPILSLLLQEPFGRWITARQLLRRLTGETAQMRFTASDFSTTSTKGSHILPWNRFAFTVRDSKNLLLFFSRYAAIIIPIANTSAEAIGFAEERIGQRQTA